MARPTVIPYMLLTQLLYAGARPDVARKMGLDFIESDATTRIVPVGEWARHNAMPPAALLKALEWMELNGYIQDFVWKSHYAIVRGVGYGLRV